MSPTARAEPRPTRPDPAPSPPPEAEASLDGHWCSEQEYWDRYYLLSDTQPHEDLRTDPVYADYVAQALLAAERRADAEAEARRAAEERALAAEQALARLQGGEI